MLKLSLMGKMSKLDWDKLLCDKRIRKSKKNEDKPVIENEFVTRNEFEADYDRIVGSSSVRRLQDKAQVFPLQKNDVVRTRLTHSMEVSALARSMAKTVGMHLEQEGIFDREKTEKLMGMLQTAGLIHDLGNPPFGHYGETAIRNWYKDRVLKEKESKASKTSDFRLSQEDKDFCYFDGNVQNLRIVTKLQTMNDAYGANFTYGTLASIIKYPYSSISETNPKKDKIGYFKSEENIVKLIWEHTGLEEGVRHPATFLLEAADDIIYICDDIEDGVKKGYVPWRKEYNKIRRMFQNMNGYRALFTHINSNTPAKKLGEREREIAQARVFRNYVQGYLMQVAVENFLKNYNSIMNGRYGLKNLLESEEKFVEALQEITRKYCFGCDEVLTLEIVGERTIKELLNIFYDAIKTDDIKKLKKTKDYEGKIYQLISDNYKYIATFDYNTQKNVDIEKISEVDKLHLIVDFISGMTDSYAVSLYKKLLGISLPE